MNSNFSTGNEKNHFYAMEDDDAGIGDFIGQLPFSSVPGAAAAALEKVPSNLNHDKDDNRFTSPEMAKNHFFTKDEEAIGDFDDAAVPEDVRRDYEAVTGGNGFEDMEQQELPQGSETEKNHFYTMEAKAIDDFVADLQNGSLGSGSDAAESETNKNPSKRPRFDVKASKEASDKEQAKAIDDFMKDLQNGTLGSGSDAAAAEMEENPVKRPGFDFDSARKHKKPTKPFDAFMRDLQQGKYGSRSAGTDTTAIAAAAENDENPFKPSRFHFGSASKDNDHDDRDIEAEAEDFVFDGSMDSFSKRKRDEYDAPEKDSEFDKVCKHVDKTLAIPCEKPKVGADATTRFGAKDLRERLCHLLELPCDTASDDEILKAICGHFGRGVADLHYAAAVNARIDWWKEKLAQIPGVDAPATVEVDPMLRWWGEQIADVFLSNADSEYLIEDLNSEIEDHLDFNFGDTVASVAAVVDAMQAPPAGVDVDEEEKTEAVATTTPGLPAAHKEPANGQFTASAVLYCHEQLAKQLRSGAMTYEDYKKAILGTWDSPFYN